MFLSQLLTGLALASITAALLTQRNDPANTLTVDLGYAKYRGVQLQNGVKQYLGVRYAAPPVADLRWRAPRDPLAAEGVQDASKLGPTCLGQIDSIGPPGDREDCLSVNIYTPANATVDSNLPVWVYIPGGAYAINANTGINGTTVVEKGDVVFVYVNYRVGMYGFLASEEIKQDGDLNVGLLDQRKAFEWVQEYIHLFGGNSSHVVAHGVSAGAGSVAIHMTSEDTPLFHGAILQNPFVENFANLNQVQPHYDSILANVSCTTLSCLRSIPIDMLQLSDIAVPYSGHTSAPLNGFLPVIDDTFIPRPLLQSFLQGLFHPLPTLIGNDRDEGTYFSPNASTSTEVLTFLSANYPLLSPADLALINATYPPLPPLPLHAPYFPTAAAAYGDATFTCPGLSLTSSISRHNGAQVWNYAGNILDPTNLAVGLGVPHTFESTAIFGLGNGGVYGDFSFGDVNAAIVPVVMGYFLGFVRALDPNAIRWDGAPIWETWGGSDGGREGGWETWSGRENGRRLRFQTNNTAMEDTDQALLGRCEVWKGLEENTQQ